MIAVAERATSPAPLARVAEELWETSYPFRLFGFVPLGHRMTVVRRHSGGLLVHSPVPWSAPLAEALERLGRIETLVAPSLMHDLWLDGWFARYPEARFLAPRSFDRRRPTAPKAADVASAFDDESDVTAVRISGMPRVRETVLLHNPTRTLIVADLLMNIRGPLAWPARWLLRLNGALGRPACSRLFRSMVRDRAAFRRSLQHVLRLDVERIVPGHGAIVERDGTRLLRSVLGPLAR